MGALGGGAALGLGIGLAWPRFGTVWSRPAALLDADFAGGRFVYSGRNYETLSALLAAIGGQETDGTIAVGPYPVPGAPEKVVNGNFSGGTTGWAGHRGGTISVVDGVCILAGNGGNIPGFAQAVTLQKGHAYQFRGKQRKSDTPTPSWTVAASADLGGTPACHLPNALVTLNEVASTFCAHADTMYVGGRHVANPSNGNSEYDDASIREVLPFAGFVQGGFAAIVSGTTPAAASGDKVIFEASDGEVSVGVAEENDRVRLVWEADTELRLIVSFRDGDVCNLLLGTVPPSTPFEATFTVKANEFRAALKGGPAVVDTAGDMPGIAKLYLKRQHAAGSTFDGELSRLTLLPAPWSEAEFLEQAADETSIAMWGDSLTAGANVSNDVYRPPQAAQLLYSPHRSILNFGIGGQTSTQIAARMGARPINVTASVDAIPATGGVAITAKNINVLFGSGAFTGSQRGWLAGVLGTMTTDASGNWTFTRASAGPSTSCPPGTPFTPELPARTRRRTQWLWLGRNAAQSGYTVEGDIAAAVASLGHTRYLIGAILTSTADGPGSIATIEARNATLASIYGARFADVLQALKDANDGSPEDLSDIAAGWVPRSKRSDAIHLNDAGYAVVAATFKAASDAMETAGWPE